MVKNMKKYEEKLNEIFKWGSYAPYTREMLPIAKAYTEDNLCLVLGAGVSVDSHIPQWNELISKLMIKVIQNKIMRNYKFSDKQIEELSCLTLENQKTSPLIQMRFIKSALEISSDDFIDIIHETLYNDSIDYNTPILNSIKNLCIGISGCQEYHSAHLRKVITYNFDDVLEQLLKKNPVYLNTIVDDNGRYNPECVNIYHVHGYIPFKSDSSKTNIVFSEEDYHQVYNNMYHWSNIAQINCFRENVCLFIGCSLTDPNIRRLLDASAKKQHYAILKRTKMKSDLFRETDKSFIEEYSKLNEQLTENYYLSLGIKIIWINEYSEIPDIINRISSIVIFCGELLNYV